MSYTVKWVLNTAERIVATVGREHRETRNQYLRWDIATNRWRPCCLVGHIAREAGAPVAELVMVNSEEVTGAASDVFQGRFTDLAVDVLQTAQRKADDGLTWGEVLDEMRLRWQTIQGREETPTPLPATTLHAVVNNKASSVKNLR